MAKDKTKRKLVAVVHADVKGYSRLMSEDDEYTVRTLAENRQEMYRLAELNDGQVVDTAGDGFLIEFPSVVDAVKFSVDFQHEMQLRNAEIPDNRKMEFRIGVNIGDVIHDGGTIHGDGVNVAARLEGLADPGGICISGAAYDQIEQRLELDYKDLGEKSVKNIAKPVRIYKVLFDSTQAPVSQEESSRPKRAPLRKSYLIAVAVLIVAFVSVGIWYFQFHSIAILEKTALEQMPDLPLPDKPSIAVLPFKNMSGDPKQEYFSDGITEDIITGLSKMPQLFVIASNSSFAYKGKSMDVKEVGRKLGVRYVLEGSVRKQRDRVRITAQLDDTQTGGHVWSERYDRKLKDIFALQDEIMKKIMLAMQVKFVYGEQLRFWTKMEPTINVELREKNWKGMYFLRQGDKNGIHMARQIFEEVITLDPDFSNAYSSLALCHLFEFWKKLNDHPKASLKKAYELAIKARNLNDSLDMPHCIMGMVYAFYRKYDEAIKEAKLAVTHNPNGANAHMYLGIILNWAGRYQESVTTLTRAIRLNPMPYSINYMFLGTAHINTKNYDKAVSVVKKGLQKYPNEIGLHMVLTQAYSLAGRYEEAREAAAVVLKLDPSYTLDKVRLPYKDRSVIEKRLEALRKAGLK